MRSPGHHGHALPIVSPVLVGRDDLVALAERRLAMVANGQGHLLMLTGEAGIGKSRLLGVVERSATTRGFRIARAVGFPGDQEVAGALMEDVARSTGDRADGAVAASTAAMASRIRDVGAVDLDSHRQHRLLVRDLADSLCRMTSDGPVLLALEDVHWADELSLEVLAHVARDLVRVPMLVVVTLRSDELRGRPSLREWRARLLGQRLAEETRLERFDRVQTDAMVAALTSGASPISRELAEALYARSDGIPLHVEELVGALARAVTPRPYGASEIAVPDTLADAILTRLHRLSTMARQVAATAAVIGRSFDLTLLASSLGWSMVVLGPPLTELQDRFLITPTVDGRGYDFRHALIRDAIYQDLPLPDRRVLHGNVASALVSADARPDDAGLSAHFELAGRTREASAHALIAARRAVSFSAHTDALHLFRRALANLDMDSPPEERAEILTCIGLESAATDDNRGAAAALAEAREAYLGLGRGRDAAALVPALVATRHLLGDDLPTRVALVETGLRELDTSGQEDPATRAALMAGLASAYMLDRRLERSIEIGQAAIQLAREAGQAAIEADVTTTLGSVLVFAGRMEEGWQLLERSIDRARLDHDEAEVARGYRMAGSCASVLVEYRRAVGYLEAGIDHAQRVELWNHRHYMAAHRAHVAWAIGDWSAAESLAAHALADGSGGITTRITGLHVLGFVAVGRGHWAAAQDALFEALQLGEEMGELQRISPAVWGLAEAALLQGDHQRAIELVKRGRDRSHDVEDAAYLFPFLITGTRAYLAANDPLAAHRWVAGVSADLERRAIPGTLPAIDHARGLLALASGSTSAARASLEAAHAGWSERSRLWEGTWAAIDLARCAARTNRAKEAVRLLGEARVTAQSLGATPLLAAIEALPATRASARPDPWAPLTEREFQVARLVAEGRTNPDIAAELGIATRTAASHVEHILGRLGASRRAEIGAWVASVAPSGSADRR